MRGLHVFSDRLEDFRQDTLHAGSEKARGPVAAAASSGSPPPQQYLLKVIIQPCVRCWNELWHCRGRSSQVNFLLFAGIGSALRLVTLVSGRELKLSIGPAKPEWR
jgi:hypothetical protein